MSAAPARCPDDESVPSAAERARLVEERRAVLEQLRGYEIVVTGLRMRARQIERLIREEPREEQGVLVVADTP